MSAQRLRVRSSGCAALALALVCGSAWGFGASRSHATRLSAWDEALRARAEFEALPKSRHTLAEFTRVMDRFRAIYHEDPAAAHASRAVEEVAELLAEQGHELGDPKSLHDAAGQYEFLAKAYPNPGSGPTSSPQALGQALDLLGPGESDDVVEARKVREVLLREYPRSSAARAARESLVVARTERGAERPRMESAVSRPREEMRAMPVADGPTVPEKPSMAAPVAIVTGIRHWSTGSYTRVVIDLGPNAPDPVAYQAVRVEHPDRIFFDLQGVKLAPELGGRMFAVTDGGLLKDVRAAQLAGGNTRVVLDVQAVAKYSAFLLPNPERLIVDIHGEAGSRAQGVGSRDNDAVESNEPVSTVPLAVSAVPAPVVRGASPAAKSGVEVSSLPPMPVTDGSASFGLPSRTASRKEAVQPRVVIPTRSTAARPVPNTVMKNSASDGADVAALGEQPGRVAATRRPTSLPVAETSAVTPVDLGSGDHYHPRSRAGAVQPTSQNRDMGHPVASGKAEPVEAAPPTTDGDTTLVRALGLKIGRIVIDAGHGGHDSGTLGAGGIEEKDVVLDVALRLGKLLHDRLGAEIVYTRADDTFIPLETRTAIANKAQADLFISVHANSSPDASARGVEVYYLNFTSDPEAMTVASRENAVSTESVHQLSDLVKKIALKDKIDESRELAADVDTSLYRGLEKGNPGLKDRGVKKAPFVVLIGANMPSILAEISFVTNPDDAAELETPEYRERVAESLYKGVAKYAETINHSAPKTKVTETERAAVR
ncbi:AMIN domain-containing protein [Granulicella sp. 5B5]|uniref:N-acetylmuramoyl-L-alanine amidase n=1 Tax=Granulicella sp. 5B5 TaxID=1617967 RepID=UPI0015F69EE2|nr:N-acetylmuramoyl-L-alanine amidase [Granulicella sp. 5B5]QMV17971.1 AMIN domain-containing protein [Granulicella sp. 5B5]